MLNKQLNDDEHAIRISATVIITVIFTLYFFVLSISEAVEKAQAKEKTNLSKPMPVMKSCNCNQSTTTK